MVFKILNGYKVLPVQVKASFWFLICSFLQKGITLLTTPIFTRLLTPIEYGQVSVFNSWMNIISIFITLRLSAGVFTQGLVKYSNDRKCFSSSFQGLTLTLTLGWTVVYLIQKEFWNRLFSLSTVQMLAMLIMIWSTNVFELWSAEQRVEYKYKCLVLLTLIISFAKPIVGVYLVMRAKNKVLARILGLALVELIGYVGLFFRQLYKGKHFFKSKYWKYALSFNLPLIPHYLSQIVLNTSDRIMIANFAGDWEAGIYSVAYSFSLIMTLFNSALMSTISPWIYKKIKSNKVGDISEISYITMIFIAMVNLMLIAFAPEIITIFAPVEYEDAIWVIPPIAMSVFFMFCYDLFAKFQFYFEKKYYIVCASVSGAVLNILLNYIFIPIFGYYVAGYTTLVCYVVYDMVHYLFMKKVCRENLNRTDVFNLKIIIGISMTFVIIGFVFTVTYNMIWIRYGILICFLIFIVIKKKWFLSNINRILEIRK